MAFCIAGEGKNVRRAARRVAQDEADMLSRISVWSIFVLGLVAFFVGAGPGAAQNFDPEERLTGGAPLNKRWSFFGSSPIPRRTVSYPNKHPEGTIVINTGERHLYYVISDSQAIRYGIGVGRLGFTWAGVTAVSAKREWPDWTPPPQMLRRRPDLPRYMPGGDDNPLGARAMYLGSTLFRIHGSNEPETIGQAVSSGCFRLTNEDVIDLYNRVWVGAKVIVIR
jgi:lipoprotein-anchoring transpeptidase ErfK/SrfK